MRNLFIGTGLETGDGDGASGDVFQSATLDLKAYFTHRILVWNCAEDTESFHGEHCLEERVLLGSDGDSGLFCFFSAAKVEV